MGEIGKKSRNVININGRIFLSWDNEIFNGHSGMRQGGGRWESRHPGTRFQGVPGIQWSGVGSCRRIGLLAWWWWSDRTVVDWKSWTQDRQHPESASGWNIPRTCRQVLRQHTNVVQVLGKKKKALGPGLDKTVLRWLASVSEEDHFLVVGDPGRENVGYNRALVGSSGIGFLDFDVRHGWWGGNTGWWGGNGGRQVRKLQLVAFSTFSEFIYS